MNGDGRPSVVESGQAPSFAIPQKMESGFLKRVHQHNAFDLVRLAAALAVLVSHS